LSADFREIGDASLLVGLRLGLSSVGDARVVLRKLCSLVCRAEPVKPAKYPLREGKGVGNAIAR